MSGRLLGRCRGGQSLLRWQIGLERLQRYFERAAQRADGRGGAALHLFGFFRIFEKLLERGRKLLRAGNEAAAFVALQNRVGLGKIEGMRAAQDARAELDGFDWVLPAMLDERAANEGQRRELIEQPQLADGVGEVELRIRAKPARPPSAAQR